MHNSSASVFCIIINIIVLSTSMSVYNISRNENELYGIIFFYSPTRVGRVTETVIVFNGMILRKIVTISFGREKS